MFSKPIPHASDVDAQTVPQWWYAVFTTPRHEKRVRQHFEARGIESFLPTYSSMRRWNNGCKVKVHSPLFPSYVFVRIGTGERGRVQQVPGVISLVGSSRGPSPVPETDISSLRAAVEACILNPHPAPAIGERVRIVTGHFVGTEGVLERVNGDSQVVVTLRTIDQRFSMRVYSDEIQVIS